MLALLCSFTSVISMIGRILLAFVILMFMIMIHETGHYAAGKMLKFKINEFAIGMGPTVFSRTKRNGEKFSIRALPLGGFCAFEGEDSDNPSPGAFNNQKPWKRLIVLFAGAFFNFVSAILICIILFSAYGELVASVNQVYDFAPTINQQLQPGDIIYKINGKNVFVLDGLERYMSDTMDITVIKENGSTVTYKGVKRQTFFTVSVKDVYVDIVSGERKLQIGDTIYQIDGQSISEEGQYAQLLKSAGDVVTVTVLGSDGTYEYTIEKGVLLARVDVTESSYKGVGMSISYKWHKFSFGKALGRVFAYCGEIVMLVLRTLGGLFTGAVGLNQVGGPISTISMTSKVVAGGMRSILTLIVLISVNLAVFNLLPVPALDGCQMVFVIIEWIARKPINRKVQAWINGIGLVLLLGFAILVDLLKL